jgi:hypothetical protein
MLITCTAEAAKTAKQAASTTSAWVLVSSLPRAYRDPVILPAQDPTYVALYTFIITSIMLSSGVMEEGKFERCLQRVNANDYTPLGTKDKLLQRLIKEAYIVKIKDNSGGEEKIEYMVGPRGKVEVDKHAVANVLRTVFGENEEDLEKRIEKSLNLGDVKASVPAQINENANANGAAEGSGTQRRTSTRASRRQTVGEDEEEEEDEDSDE